MFMSYALCPMTKTVAGHVHAISCNFIIGYKVQPTKLERRPRNRGGGGHWGQVPPTFCIWGKSALFRNGSALFSWNRSALVSGTIELILKRFYTEISFVFGERKYSFHDFLMICLICTAHVRDWAIFGTLQVKNFTLKVLSEVLFIFFYFFLPCCMLSYTQISQYRRSW